MTLEQVKSSSPVRPDETAAKLEEVSMCSTILVPNAANDTKTVKVDETLLSANATLFGAGPAPQHKTLLDKLELGRVKKAGPFLEDIRIFLSGFNEKDEMQVTCATVHMSNLFVKLLLRSPILYDIVYPYFHICT